jgi:hypothetical protein
MAMTNATLGDMLDNGDQLTVYCETWGCQHGKTLDLAALAERYGRGHGAMHRDLVKLPWKCEKCGGRNVSFRVSPGAMQYTFHRAVDPDEPF